MLLWKKMESGRKGNPVMLLVNKLTRPGGIKRIELHPDTVRVVLTDGVEKIYYNNEPREATLEQPSEEVHN